MAKISQEELIEFVTLEYKDKRKLGELSQLTGVSKSYISKWLSGKATWDTSEFEKKVRKVYSRRRMSARDEKILLSVINKIDECDNPKQTARAVADAFDDR